MRSNTSALSPTVVLLTVAFCGSLRAEPPALDSFNVVWNTPSENAAGSMPIGNGEVGLNLWVEPGGELVFYLARTDAWSEVNRLLKLGAVRVRLDPPLVQPGEPFRQELMLRAGCVEIRSGAADRQATLRVFVDAEHPVVHVTGAFDTPRTVRAELQCWRNERHVLRDPAELKSSWTMRDAPADIEVWESADVVASDVADAVVWYHRNEHSIVPLTLRHQGLESLRSAAFDPLIQRTFGGWMSARGFQCDGQRELRSAAPVREFELQIVTHCAQTATVEEWKQAAGALHDAAPRAAAAAEATQRWWSAFWERS